MNKDVLTGPWCRRVTNGGRKFGHHGRLAKEISKGRDLNHFVPGPLCLLYTQAIIEALNVTAKATATLRHEMSCRLCASSGHLVGILGHKAQSCLVWLMGGSGLLSTGSLISEGDRGYTLPPWVLPSWTWLQDGLGESTRCLYRLEPGREAWGRQ